MAQDSAMSNDEIMTLNEMHKTKKGRLYISGVHQLQSLIHSYSKFPDEQRENYILNQSQKTQGFRVADFATLSDERRSRSKIFLPFNMDKRTLRSKI